MHAVHTAIRFPLICRFAYAGTEECRMLKAGATLIMKHGTNGTMSGQVNRVPARIESNYDLLD